MYLDKDACIEYLTDEGYIVVDEDEEFFVFEKFGKPYVLIATEREAVKLKEMIEKADEKGFKKLYTKYPIFEAKTLKGVSE